MQDPVAKSIVIALPSILMSIVIYLLCGPDTQQNNKQSFCVSIYWAWYWSVSCLLVCYCVSSRETENSRARLYFVSLNCLCDNNSLSISSKPCTLILVWRLHPLWICSLKSLLWQLDLLNLHCCDELLVPRHLWHLTFYFVPVPVPLLLLVYWAAQCMLLLSAIEHFAA